MGIAIKCATIFPGNKNLKKPAINGAVNLFDDQTGQLSAVIDFHLVTKWKTAGDSILAAKLLARPNSRNILILGAGGVTPSIILGLRMIGVKKIIVSNRTKDKVLKLKERFSFIEVLNWGETVKANAIINTTSVGLKKTDKIQLNNSLFTPDTFFYDVIYNPKETNFLKKAKNEGCIVQNGLMMFINQAAVAFKTWHNIMPKIDKNLIEFLQND